MVPALFVSSRDIKHLIFIPSLSFILKKTSLLVPSNIIPQVPALLSLETRLCHCHQWGWVVHRDKGSLAAAAADSINLDWLAGSRNQDEAGVWGGARLYC